MPHYTIQHIHAPKSKTGAPRRLYLITATPQRPGDQPEAYPENGRGTQAIPPEVFQNQTPTWLPHINVTTAEYHRLTRTYPASKPQP